ncbi:MULTISPECIES: L-threonylcarbamoyladenylate synthase [Actinomadura]|uniref:tRNA A37 threonylcarbamoyladenosine synthetase subunit TsaC/SUA5/YrdC n=1 Tax=Actinomadura madurae TaxID=1993 RepID=A0A1I5NNX1_9ACTN|nr:Sua5/YciO/YrdC/YwlC family protein [Actinomadura madurae]SFP23515.1 tRNA A37 threonylcarbamoyladenosine synthetase subunit TsaC/SUA5/YrdC [Actinomadura madurae]
MGRYDIKGDAQRIYETVAGGGAVIMPGDVGYAATAISSDALLRLFQAKRRAPHKRHAMGGNYELHREVHRLGKREQDMIDAVVVDAGLPLAIAAHYDPSHPVVASIEPETLAASTVGSTLAMLINGGALHDEVVRIAHRDGVALLGSSANLTGTGTRFRVEDIQQEIIDAVDLVVDHGLRKYHHYGRSSTIIDFSTMEVVRVGTCYELISDIFERQFGITLPADPGRDVLPSGHLREQASAG